MHESLRAKRVLVTAGATGIGRAIAEAFHEAGAQVHVCDVSDEAIAEIRRNVPEIGATPADVADPAQIETLFDEALERLGGLDVLINNAGIAGPAGPIEDCSLEDWRRTLAVNLDGQFLCLRRAIPVMKAARAGSVVNISSTAGLFGYPLRAPYAASKWAVVGLSKSMASELGPWGIRVNAICPGAVEGPRMDRVIAAEAAARGTPPEAIRAGYTGQVSLRAFVTARDIADSALFLCSDAGRMISGQALSVDGNTEILSN